MLNLKVTGRQQNKKRMNRVYVFAALIVGSTTSQGRSSSVQCASCSLPTGVGKGTSPESRVKVLRVPHFNRDMLRKEVAAPAISVG